MYRKGKTPTGQQALAQCAWAWVLGGFGSGRWCMEVPSFGQSDVCEVVRVCHGVCQCLPGWWMRTWWGWHNDGCGAQLAKVGDARWWQVVVSRWRMVGGEWLGIVVTFSIMFRHRWQVVVTKWWGLWHIHLAMAEGMRWWGAWPICLAGVEDLR